MLALTALLHAAHGGQTASRPRDTLSECSVCVCAREKSRGRAVDGQMVRQRNEGIEKPQRERGEKLM